MKHFIGSGLTIWSFALLFSGFGGLLISQCTRPILRPSVKLLSTLGFFVGISIFLGMWRIQAILLQSARSGFYGATLFLVAFLVLRRDRVRELIGAVRGDWKSLIAQGFWIAFCHIFCGAFWSRDFYSNPYSGMGSGHSPRYANIAFYIFDSDHIPSLGQNYGQSMLAMIPSYFAGLRVPLVSLNIWLSLSVAVLGVLTYSLLRWLKVAVWTSIAGVVIVLLGNTALTKKHVYILDSGSPFFVTGYTDTIFCLGSFIAFFYMLLQFAPRPSWREWLFRAVSIFCFGLSWTMSAPQNLVIGIGLAVFLCLFPKVLWSDGVNRDAKLRRSMSFALAFLLFAMISGVFTGGMFSSHKFRDDVNIPGLQTVSRPGGSLISYLPTVPFCVGSYFGWEGGWLKSNWAGNPTENYSAFETLLARLKQAVILIFYPVAGIFSLGLCVLGGVTLTSKVKPVLRVIWGISALSLLGGFLVSFPIAVSGYKWELSRFSTVGYYLGLSSLVLSIYHLVVRRTKIVGYGLLSLVMFGATYGPVKSISELLKHELKDFPSLSAKYRALAQYTQVRT